MYNIREFYFRFKKDRLTFKKLTAKRGITRTLERSFWVGSGAKLLTKDSTYGEIGVSWKSLSGGKTIWKGPKHFTREGFPLVFTLAYPPNYVDFVSDIAVISLVHVVAHVS